MHLNLQYLHGNPTAAAAVSQHFQFFKTTSDTKFEVPHTVSTSPYHSSPECTLVADTFLAGPAENTELLMMVFTP